MATYSTAAEAFWRYSLMVYSRPGVAEALLRLQDQGGHNVNLMLFGLWLGRCAGTVLDAGGLACAKSAIARLDTVVVAPLRALRRALKENPDEDVRALRRRVLALEIAAERRVQARLAASVAWPHKVRSDEPRAAAEANLRLVLGGDFETPEAATILGVIE